MVWVSFLSTTHLNSILTFVALSFFAQADKVSSLRGTMNAGWSNGENGDVGDQGIYHHGTKKTIFVFWGFGDITFSFAPFMLPLAFSMLCFFATDLPPFFSPLCLLLFLSLALC